VKVSAQKRASQLKVLGFSILMAALVSSVLLPCGQAANCRSGSAEQVEKPTLSEEEMHGKTFVVCKLHIKAKPEQVWQILADYNNASHVFPILKECELLEDKGTTKITRHVIAPSGVPGTYEYVLEIREAAPSTMEWHRVSGDFHDVDGYWKLEPEDLGHHTLVTYASYVNGGLFIPQVLIRHQFHVDMPQALIALRNRAELDQQKLATRHPGTHPASVTQ
jgi:hypothetical protein